MPGGIAVTVVFEPNLPLADMKARLVLNRLSSRGGSCRTDPPAEQLDEVESLPRFTVVPGGRLRRRRAARPGRRRGRGRGPDRAIASPAARSPAAAGSPAPSAGQPAASRVARPPAAAAPIEAGSRRRRELDRAAGVRGGRGRRRARPGSRDAGDAAPAPQGRRPKKARVAETIRVDSDRLDHLMNLAGELVITKARFVAIARGLEELFRGSNAQALASDTQDRLDSITRGLEGLAPDQGRLGPGLRLRRLARPLVGAGPPAPRELPRDPGRARR